MSEKISPATQPPVQDSQSLHAEPVKGQIVDSNADIGLRYLTEHGVIEYSEAEERAVCRKIDLYFLPILAVTYALQYLDKVTLSYAAVYGMRDDLHLVNSQYSWATSLFYFGYAFGEFPANFLMQKLPIGKFVGVNIFIWGILVMLTAVTKDFAGLAVVRFLMGAFEACIGPCWIQLTSMFYKTGEQGARVSVWYSTVGVAQIIGGFLSWGIGNVNTKNLSVETWQLVYLICGGFTVLWSVVIFTLLPESPAVAYFFSQREKSIAIERLRSNRTGIKNKKFKWYQARDALKDPQCWLIAFWGGITMIMNISGSFKPIIIKDMGFSSLTTTLLIIPAGAIELVAMGLGGFFSSKFKNARTIMMFVLALPTLAGCGILAGAPRYMTWLRLCGVWTMSCVPASYALLLSLISSNVAGTSKKVVVTLMQFLFWCVGNIVSPQLFLTNEAPTYVTGIRSLLVSICLCQLLTVVLGAYYYFENKRRDRAVAQAGPEIVEASTAEFEEFQDRTDREDWVKFRYRW